MSSIHQRRSSCEPEPLFRRPALIGVGLIVPFGGPALRASMLGRRADTPEWRDTHSARGVRYSLSRRTRCELTRYSRGRQRLNIAASDGQFSGKRRTLFPQTNFPRGITCLRCWYIDVYSKRMESNHATIYNVQHGRALYRTGACRAKPPLRGLHGQGESARPRCA